MQKSRYSTARRCVRNRAVLPILQLPAGNVCWSTAAGVPQLTSRSWMRSRLTRLGQADLQSACDWDTLHTLNSRHPAPRFACSPQVQPGQAGLAHHPDVCCAVLCCGLVCAAQAGVQPERPAAPARQAEGEAGGSSEQGVQQPAGSQACVQELIVLKNSLSAVCCRPSSAQSFTNSWHQQRRQFWVE